ncbi:hypothetical protein TNCV_1499561 [Trichonephila clavipes]|nr:hypothetical protein TNCV_1499561 [Trichonephila clavipes]
MDVCKCTVSSLHGGTLNSRRATSLLVRLVDGDRRREAPVHCQSGREIAVKVEERFGAVGKKVEEEIAIVEEKIERIKERVEERIKRMAENSSLMSQRVEDLEKKLPGIRRTKPSLSLLL